MVKNCVKGLRIFYVTNLDKVIKTALYNMTVGIINLFVGVHVIFFFGKLGCVLKFYSHKK
jgi:hypothetical protein